LLAVFTALIALFTVFRIWSRSRLAMASTPT
jgi:hypothetical protein